MEETFSLNWGALWRWRLLIAGAFIVCTMLAAAWYFLAPRQWAAVGLVRIGSIATIAPGSTEPVEVPIEPVPTAIDRMLNPPAVRQAARGAGYPGEVQHLLSRAYGGRGDIQIMQLPGTNLVSIRVVTDHREKSRRIAQALSNDLIRAENALIQPLWDSRVARVQTLSRSLAALRQQPDKAADGVRLELARMRLRSELQHAQESISYPRLIKTQTLGHVSVLARPVSPRPLVAVALAITLGLLFTFGVLIWDALGRCYGVRQGKRPSPR